MKERRRLLFIFVVTACVLATIGIAAFALWRERVSGDVQRQLQAIHAAGLPASPSEVNAYYSNVPDAENAAIGVLNLAASLRSYPDAGKSNRVANFSASARNKALSKEEIDLLTGYLAINAETLNSVRQATQLPASHYPLDLSEGFSATIPYLSGITSLGRLMQIEGLLAVENRKAADAVDSMEMDLRLARTLGNEPVLISQLVRLRLIRMACENAERTLSAMALDHSQLERLAADFAPVDKTGNLERAFVTERACGVPLFGMSPQEMENFGSGGPAPPHTEQPWFFRASGFFEKDCNFYLTCMATNIVFAGEAPPQSLGIKEFEETHVTPAPPMFHIISKMLLPGLTTALFREATTLAEIRCARMALAVELYRQTNGALPESLQQLDLHLADPFDGQPLRYHRRAEGGYIVYSVGPDRKDDGGKEAPKKAVDLAKERYDLPFVVGR